MNPDKSIEDRYKGIKTKEEKSVQDNILEAFNLVFNPENSLSFDVTGVHYIEQVIRNFGAVPWTTYQVISFPVPINARKAVVKYIGFEPDNNFLSGIRYNFFLKVNNSIKDFFPLAVYSGTVIPSIEVLYVINKHSVSNPLPVLYMANGGDIIDISVQYLSSFGTAPTGYVSAMSYARIKGWYEV